VSAGPIIVLEFNPPAAVIVDVLSVTAREVGQIGGFAEEYQSGSELRCRYFRFPRGRSMQSRLEACRSPSALCTGAAVVGPMFRQTT
jgi:hypothetical protein